MRVAIVGLMFSGVAGAAEPPWQEPCLAVMQAAQKELVATNPIFKKAKVGVKNGEVTFSFKRGRRVEEYEASIYGSWDTRRSPWYDPGCGEGCPVLIQQRWTLSRQAGYYVSVTEQDEETQQAFDRIFRGALDKCFALPEGGPGFEAGFWKSLVRAGARWELTSPGVGVGEGTLTVETYDVRRVGAADVARLRWTFVDKDGKKRDVGDSASGRYTQVAVTDAGLYLLDADQDDASVTTWLGKKPARSDPPAPYAGTTQNQGRYLELVSRPGGAVACMAVGPVPDREEAKRGENGALCIARDAGVVRIDGKFSPTGNLFIQKAFDK